MKGLQRKQQAMRDWSKGLQGKLVTSEAAEEEFDLVQKAAISTAH